jgi:hypothetical protein
LPVGVFESAALALEAVALDLQYEQSLNKIRSKKKSTLKESEEINELRIYIYECLKSRRKPTVRGGASRIGRSLEYTSKLPPMRAYIDGREKSKSGAMGKAISLTHAIEEAAAAKDHRRDGDPNFTMDESQFLKTATDKERAYYSDLNDQKDKENFIYSTDEDRRELLKLIESHRVDEKSRKVQPG